MIDFVTQKRDEIAAHCRRLDVRRLEVFGSAVSGTFDPATSDLDFLVEFSAHDRPGILGRYLDLAESLETLFNRRVDLVTVPSVRNPRFRAELDATKEPVYVS
jgi:predicted nucleotidyltransferase